MCTSCCDLALFPICTTVWEALYRAYNSIKFMKTSIDPLDSYYSNVNLLKITPPPQFKTKLYLVSCEENQLGIIAIFDDQINFTPSPSTGIDHSLTPTEPYKIGAGNCTFMTYLIVVLYMHIAEETILFPIAVKDIFAKILKLS